jgi:hypothetical protein
MYGSREEGNGPSVNNLSPKVTNLTYFGVGASEYFERTENIAGVKVWQTSDKRYQPLTVNRTCDFKP